jgi:hypothetical protein
VRGSMCRPHGRRTCDDPDDRPLTESPQDTEATSGPLEIAKKPSVSRVHGRSDFISGDKRLHSEAPPRQVVFAGCRDSG